MEQAPEEGQAGQADELRSLRLLRILVTVLMVVMIAGFIVLIGFLVTRFPAGTGSGAELALPEGIVLPEGTGPEAVTRGKGWLAVVTDDGRILIYGAEGGAPVQEIEVRIGTE